jgi:carbonic anhydrase/acetyltransferase-like protein (isoleucine patch superfamily)
MLLKYKNYFPTVGNKSWIAPNTSVIGDVEIGENCSIWFGAIVRGDVHSIKIGNNSNIQDLSMVHVTHHKGENRTENDGNATIIGDNVTVGHKVMLHGCTVEDACLIGMSATILDGAVIGKESIVGAGSLVTKNKVFPPRSLIIGSPAKRVRELTTEEIEEIYNSATRYVKFKDNYLDQE